MARGKGGGDDWGKILLILGIAVGGFTLYYLTAGREDEDAAFIPDQLEARIDLVVHELNKRFGHAWVNLGLDILERYLKSVLPWPVVGLVSVIYQVEQLPGMRGPAKQWEATNRLRRAIP